MLVKIIGTALSVSSGLPVGPEGPLVHIGAGVASFCTRQQRMRCGERVVLSTHGVRGFDTFHNDLDRRDFLRRVLRTFFTRRSARSSSHGSPYDPVGVVHADP